MPIKKIKTLQYIDLYEVFLDKNKYERERGIFLLKKAYRELYLETFPIPSERETFEAWRDSLENLETNSDLQSFSLFGFDLDREHPQILGLIVTSFYTGTSCGLIDYIIRKKGFSKVLPATLMLDLQERILNEICLKHEKKSLKMILWEANDPQNILWDDKNPDYKKDCMNPQKRIDHIQQTFNCRRIGITYVQAPIETVCDGQEADEKICTNLQLFLYKACYYNKATADDLERFLIAFSKACSGRFPDELRNSHIDRMMRQVSVMKRYNIPLLYEDQSIEQKELIKNA